MRVMTMALALGLLAGCKQPTGDVTANKSAVATAAPDTPAAPANAIASTIDLSAYVGKYPDDRVGGVAFKDVPAVRSAVAAVVPDKAIAATVIAFDGPNTPIASKDGRLLAYGCETHNCGAHNWTIAIAPDGKDAAVCYKADDATVPHWFGADVPAGNDDSCPSGDNG